MDYHPSESQRLSVGRHLLAAGLSLALGAGQASARIVKGPFVAAESAGTAGMGPAPDSDAEAPEAEVGRQRREAMLLAPVPARVFGTMVVLKLDLFSEHRSYSSWEPAAAAEAFKDHSAKAPGTLGSGVIVVPHPKEGAPNLFVIAERYGGLSDWDGDLPMAEFVVGADLDDDLMPFPVKPDAADQAESRLLLRYRRFPGFVRWVPYVGHRIEAAGGWLLDVAFPSHALTGWQTTDRAWRLYAGARAVSREYPGRINGRAGWFDGHTGSVLLGLRRRLIEPLFLAAEGGVQRETMRFTDVKGEELTAWQTEWTPWGRVALETWISQP